MQRDRSLSSAKSSWICCFIAIRLNEVIPSSNMLKFTSKEDDGVSNSLPRMLTMLFSVRDSGPRHVKARCSSSFCLFSWSKSQYSPFSKAVFNFVRETLPSEVFSRYDLGKGRIVDGVLPVNRPTILAMAFVLSKRAFASSLSKLGL